MSRRLIIDRLTSIGEPQAVRTIAQDLDLPQVSTSKTLRQLAGEGRICRDRIATVDVYWITPAQAVREALHRALPANEPAAVAILVAPVDLSRRLAHAERLLARPALSDDAVLREIRDDYRATLAAVLAHASATGREEAYA